MIRVLHVVNNLNRGGAETMIMNLYRNINRNQIQFDFLCLRNLNGDYESEIEKLGGTIYKIYDTQFFSKLKKIYQLFKQNQFNVIHSHIMFYSGIIQFLSFCAGIKIRITHSHSSNDLKKMTFFRRIYLSFSRILINVFTTDYLSCGKKAGKYLYGSRKKFLVINNGIDLDLYKSVTKENIVQLKNELHIKKDDFIIGHIGSFIDVKNHEYFIDFCKEMLKITTNFKIVLVGTGEKYEKIIESVKQNNLEPFFCFTGLRSDTPVFMNMFDIFLMPSLYEGFPLTVVEALAGNCICFLSNRIPTETRIIPERVYFFDLDSPKFELIQQIRKCKKEELDVYTCLIEKGFSIKNMVQTMSNIYLKKRR